MTATGHPVTLMDATRRNLHTHTHTRTHTHTGAHTKTDGRLLCVYVCCVVLQVASIWHTYVSGSLSCVASPFSERDLGMLPWASSWSSPSCDIRDSLSSVPYGTAKCGPDRQRQTEEAHTHTHTHHCLASHRTASVCLCGLACVFRSVGRSASRLPCPPWCGCGVWYSCSSAISLAMLLPRFMPNMSGSSACTNTPHELWVGVWSQWMWVSGVGVCVCVYATHPR